MRVLNVNHTLDPVSGGGTSERTFQLSRALVRAGVECDVLTLDLGLTLEREEGLSGAKLVALPTVSRRFYVPRFSPKKLRALVQKADVVHLMGHWTMINALVYLYAHRLDKPYVVCSAGALPFYGRSQYLKIIYNRVIGKKILQDADGHVAITADEIPQFAPYGIEAARVTVVPNGIDAGDYQSKDDAGFRRKHGLGSEPFVLFVGRLNRIKGPDLLLEAFVRASEKLPRHQLVFVGPDDGMLPELRELVLGSGVADRVHFVGYLGDGEKSRAYNAADLMVVPSRQEAMSIVALEAGAAGTPVLLTDRCGFDEVERASGGRVVSASIEGLRTGLVELLGDPNRLERMGVNLKELVEGRYTWEAAVERYLDLYHDILDGSRSVKARAT